MSTRPHLLYVAWGFPPSRTGGVHRALATANAFAAADWRVSVITAPREVFADLTGADAALEGLIDPRVEVLRVPFSWPAKDSDLRRFSPLRVLTPRLWAKARAIRDCRAFPEVGYGPWRHRIEAAARDLHHRAPVHLTMATTNPQVSVSAAVRLHHDFAVPYVIDYRDAWTLHTYSGRRALSADSPAGRYEAMAFSKAAEIWFVNEPLRRWHAGQYPGQADRMHVVMNGYDRDLPAVSSGAPATEAASPQRPLTFGYLGTMTAVVPLRELIDGWHAGRRHPELDGATAELHGYLGYYATPDPALADLVDTAAGVGLSYAGPVSKTLVAQTYAGFDVAILLLGGGEYVTSGKVFEYMSTGLPVVSVLTPGNAAAEVLTGYPRWHPAADLSPEAIAVALVAAARDARCDDAAERAEAARQFARRYRRDAQLAPRIDALRAVVSDAAARPA